MDVIFVENSAVYSDYSYLVPTCVTASPNHVAALNPDADSFEASKSPEETADATTNWDSVSEPEYSPVEGYVYMNGDIGKLPSGAVYPATPDSLASAASTSSDYGSLNGVAGGEQLEVYAQPVSPPGGAPAEPLPGGNAGIPLDHLKHLLSTQLEYYFSRENLANDTYLLSQMDNDQYVPIWTVANFNQVKRLTKDIKLITEVLRESPNVQVDEDGQKVRPNHKRCIVILREIPDNTPIEEVKALFSGEGCPKLISCEFAHNNSWYVTFESDEDAQKAYRFLREEVREFQGKPIMARIKAKPMNRLPIHPAAVAPSIGAQLKNGFRTPPAPAIYDPTAYQAGQHPGRFLYTNGTSLPPTVNYGNQVHVYTFQQQPFYPPSMIAPWGPPSPAYFDIGSVFSVNGLTPQGFSKPPNSRFIPRNRKRNPVGNDRQSLPDTSSMSRQHAYHYTASNNSGNNTTASGISKSIPSTISATSSSSSGAKPPPAPSSTVSIAEAAHLLSNHHHSKPGGLSGASGPILSSNTTGGNNGNVTGAGTGANAAAISGSQPGLITEGVESSSSQIQPSSTRVENDENLYRTRETANKDPLTQRRRRKDDEQLTSSRASGNNSAVSGSTGASSKLSGVGVPGAESGGSPAGGGSGSGGGTSATAVGQFDLEASAFPPLPGLEQPATATSKHHHHHHHHYPHHHHHHASGSGGSANTSTATTTTGSNAQADAVTVDQPAPSSHWGENRLADVVKGTAKSNKSQIGGTSSGVSTSKEGLPSLPANTSINPSSSSPSCPSPRATSPAVTVASTLPTPIASAAVTSAPVTTMPSSQPSQLSLIQTSGDKENPVHEINFSSTTLTPPSSPDKTVPVAKNMADKSTKTDEVMVNGGESSSMTVASQTLTQSSTVNTSSIASLTPYTVSVAITTSTTSISTSSNVNKLHSSVASSPASIPSTNSNIISTSTKPIPTTTNAATMTSAVVVTDVTSGSSTIQTSTTTTNSRSSNTSASPAFVANATNTSASSETCLIQQENACPGRLSYAQVAQHHREKAERLLRDKNSTGASNSVANESSNSEKEVRSSGNERRKDSASSVQTTTGMSTNSNVNAAGSSRIALQHGESREPPQHRDFLGAARYVGRGAGGGSRSSGPSAGGRGTRRDATGGGSSGGSSGSASNTPGTRFRESLQRSRSPK